MGGVPRPSSCRETLGLRRGTAQVGHSYGKDGNEMTERQVGRQMQTAEPILRVRSATGLQKASNFPPSCSIQSAFYTW